MTHIKWFLEAVASLGLVVSLSQSVRESGSQVLAKLDKVSIGWSRRSPVKSYMVLSFIVLYSLKCSCIALYSPVLSFIREFYSGTGCLKKNALIENRLKDTKYEAKFHWKSRFSSK